jgi:hypothetical protein
MAILTLKSQEGLDEDGGLGSREKLVMSINIVAMPIAGTLLTLTQTRKPEQSKSTSM